MGLHIDFVVIVGVVGVFLKNGWALICVLCTLYNAYIYIHIYSGIQAEVVWT